MSKILGDVLKKAREKKGLSIDSVAEETKIQKRYLLDLEDENFDDMPGKVYERGFLRTYAELLGLNLDDILKLHDEVRGEKKEALPNIDEEEEHKNRKQKQGKLKIFLSIIILVFIGFSVVKVLELIDKKSHKIEAVNGIDEKIQEEFEPKEQEVTADIPESEIEIVETSTKSSIEIKLTKRIEIKLNGKTWLQVYVNGKKEKEGEFEANESVVYEGQENDQIFVKIGNIKNAEVYFNGKQEDENIAYKNVWKKTF